MKGIKSGMLAASFPWWISLLVHAGVFTVGASLYMARAIADDGDADRVIIPEARLDEKPTSLIGQGRESVDMQAGKAERRTKRHEYRKQPVRNMLSEISTDRQSDLRIIGIGVGADGGPAAYRLRAGRGQGPRASFYGSGGNAYKVCYVIDRSGSLLDTFDYLREELKQSIRGLVPQQQFHVIFFSGGKPEEMPSRKLLYATLANKKKAFAFLNSVVPSGQTNPEPAIERAFAYKPELIYFMTDGDFPPKILDLLGKLNEDRKIKINTLSFVFKPGEELLRKIADEHGGRYKHVSEDDLGQ